MPRAAWAAWWAQSLPALHSHTLPPKGHMEGKTKRKNQENWGAVGENERILERLFLRFQKTLQVTCTPYKKMRAWTHTNSGTIWGRFACLWVQCSYTQATTGLLCWGGRLLSFQGLIKQNNAFWGDTVFEIWTGIMHVTGNHISQKKYASSLSLEGLVLFNELCCKSLPVSFWSTSGPS